MPAKARSHRDVWHGEIVTWLHEGLGVLSRSNPTQSYQEPAAADIFIPRLVIEVKTARKGLFSFVNDWKPEQRAWAEKHCRPSGAEYWVAVVYDRINSNWRVNRACFLVPYEELVHAHEMVKPVQDSLPYKLTKYHSLYLRENQLEAVTIWKDFELSWVGKTEKWVVPETHAFTAMYGTVPTLYHRRSSDGLQGNHCDSEKAG
jgi:hypothetical protein